MATLTRCPICAGNVSSAAQECPTCGHTGPFTTGDEPPPINEIARPQTDQDTHRRGGDGVEDVAAKEVPTPGPRARTRFLRRPVLTLVFVVITAVLGHVSYRISQGEKPPAIDEYLPFLTLSCQAKASSTTGWEQVSTGRWHSCGVKTDGKVECWGESRLASAPPNGTFSEVAVGYSRSCGIRRNGEVECWYSSPNQIEKPTPPGKFVGIAGGRHTCGIRADNTLICWGCDEVTSFQSAPCTDTPWGHFVDVSAGERAPCAVEKNGGLVCWGDQRVADVPERSRYLSVASSGGNNCALNTDGTVECWGHNLQGQCDAPDGSFTEITAGWWHMCGLREDGTVDCWGCCEGDRAATKWMSEDGGSCDRGQCSTPGGTFTQISAGGETTCGITTEGTVQCWGDNREGQASPP